MVLHCGPGCTVVLGPYAVVLVVTVLWYLSLHSGTGCPCSLLLAITERLYCSQNCSTGCHCTVAMVTIPQYWSLQYHVVLAVTVLWNWSLYCGTGCHCTVVLVPKCGTGPRTDYQLSLCCCAAHPLYCGTVPWLSLRCCKYCCPKCGTGFHSPVELCAAALDVETRCHPLNITMSDSQQHLPLFLHFADFKALFKVFDKSKH